MFSRRNLLFCLSVGAAALGLAPAGAITVDPGSVVGPAIERWGWDLKGNQGLTNNQPKAQALYSAVPANLIRIPIFVDAHFSDGSVDTARYTQMIASIQNAKLVNPDIEVFASVKLDGGDSFLGPASEPGWVTQGSAEWAASTGTIFNNPAPRPNPVYYSQLVADYFDYLDQQGIQVDYIGLNNETDGALGESRYIDTVDRLKTELDTRGYAADELQFIGPDSFSPNTAINILNNLDSQGRLDTVDIVGSHQYPQFNNHTSDTWVTMSNITGGKDMWHTEVHMNPANANNGDPPEQNIRRMRDAMAVVFTANQAGVDSFVWWQGGTGSSVNQTLMREIIKTTIDAVPVGTSEAFAQPANNATQAMYQGYLSTVSEELVIWIANPGGEQTDLRVDLDSGLLDAGFAVTGAYWAGPGNVIGDAPGDFGRVNATVDPDRGGLTIASVPEDSIARLTVALAPLTWDPDQQQDNDGGAGVWNTTASSWFNAGQSAVWMHGADATFGSSGADYTVDLAAGGIIVDDLTLEAGAGKVSFKAAVDGEGITVMAGGAVWDTGGREIELVNNNDANDTALFIGAGDTLAVVGAGGVLDTGEKPGGANWDADGATLDIQDAITVRGNAGSVGQFERVKLADGAAYIHERNTPQTYNNDWQLNGAVTLGVRWNRTFTLGGDITGSGGLTIDVGNQSRDRAVFGGVNTYTGGTTVASGVLELLHKDALPGTGVGLTVADGQRVELAFDNGADWGSLDVLLLSLAADFQGASYLGLSTAGGDADLTTALGGNAGLWKADANTLTLQAAQGYAGPTRIETGTIMLGVADALPTSTVLTIGGEGTSLLELNGFDQTLGGLVSTGFNTREIHNTGVSAVTLTLDVADGQTHNYASNFDDSAGGAIHLIKQGLGTQVLSRSSALISFSGGVTVDTGTLQIIGNPFVNTAGTFTVNDGGTLGVDSTLGGQVVVNTGGTLAPGASAGTLAAAGLTLDDGSVLDFEIEFDSTLDAGQQTVGGVSDLITLTGDLVLDGVLNVDELDAVSGAFADASAGTTWRLIDYAGTLTDNTLELGTLPALGSGLGYALDTNTPGQVNLIVIAALIPGDADGDGDIDDTDLGIAISNFTGPVGAAGNKTVAQGDTDGDGDVDDTDLGVAISGFTGPLSPSTVPEPASAAMLGALGLLATRRRRAS